MAQRQTYQLKLYDRALAQFQFEPTLTGFRASCLEVDSSAVHLLPLNLGQVQSDVELARFLESRRIPKGRTYLEEVLRPYGLAPSDTKGIIDLSRGVSVNDVYSIVPADDDIPYGEYNLFDNRGCGQKVGPFRSGEESAVPSYTKEQRERALEVLEECEGRVTLAITKLGYPSRQTMYQWINGAGAARTRTAGRPFSHYDPQLKEDAVRMVRGGLDPGDVARHLGVSSAAVVYNWARSREKEAAPMRDEPAKASGDEPAWSGFDGSPEDRIRQLELENDILRGVVEVLKAARPRALTNGEKTLVIEHLRRTTDHSLRELTDSLRISKSSYEYQRASIARGDKYARVRRRIVEIFEAANRTRGYRYVTRRLRDGEDPVVVSEKVVRRLMREEGCRVVYLKRAKGYSSYAGEISDAPDNLVERRFHADAPNRLWLSDITEFGLPCGKCYLSPVLDCFDGALVSWSISASPDAALANSSLEGACAALLPGEHPVCHTDRGCHYRWPGWIALCERNGLVRSMSKKGCSPDNAAMEGFFGRLKNEFFFHRDWRGVTMEEFAAMLDAYLRFYNEGRIKESLGWKSPMQYRRSLGLAA